MSTDLFSFFEFEKVAVFTLPKDAWLSFIFNFNEERFGFDIKIKANDKEVSFDMWAYYDWLTPFLEAVTDLLPLHETVDKYTRVPRTYSHCNLYDNDGRSNYFFSFKNVNSQVLVIIRKDTTEEQEESGVCYGLTDEFSQEDIAAIEKTVLLTFSIVNNHLSYKLKEACDNLLLQLPLTKYRKVLGYDFPVKYYRRLADYCEQQPYGFP
jgi:hypothetical protein